MNALANMLPAIFKSLPHPNRKSLEEDIKKRAVDPSSNADGGFSNNSSQKTVFPAGTATRSTATKETPSSTLPVTVPSSSAVVTPTSPSSITTLTPSSASSTYIPISSAVTSSPSSSSAADTNDNGGISGGAIGAIVAVILIICGGCLAFLIMRRRRQKRMIARAGAGALRDPYNEGFVSFPPPPPMVFTSPHHQDVSAAAGPAQYQHQLQPITTPNMINTSPLTSSTIPATMLTSAPAPGDIWQQAPIGTFTVVTTYVPTLSDEIDIQSNDQVQIFEEYDDGWCLGLNLSRGQTRGVFPKHCVVAPAVPANPSSMSLAVSEPTVATTLGKRVSSLYMENPNPIHS